MNTHRQRDVYEVELLDDLHHLFPEILYDNTLFPHDSNDRFGNTLSWIRYRLSVMFPQTFSLARQAYSQNLAGQRRNEFEEWMWLRRGDSQNQRVVHSYAGMSPLQASLNRNPWATPEQQPIRVPVIPASRVLGRDAVNQIITNTMLDELLGNLVVPRQTLRTNLNNFFDSIPVQPTLAEINLASEIIQSDSPLIGDAICAVCQDHDSPRDSSGAVASNGWRKLRTCNHMFHKNCIDRWFESHVHCPVCRADIREFSRQQTNSNQTSAQFVGETAPAGPPS